MNATKQEWMFALVISATHGAQHFFSRLIPPLIPLLAVALEMNLAQLGFLISAYSIGSGFGQTPFGILSDRHDRRFILPPGLGVLGASYVVFALAPIIGAPLPGFDVLGYAVTGPYLVMCAAMLVGGFGASVVHPTGYPLISANVSEDNKGKTLGAFGSAAKVGDAAAPALIGVLILVLVWEQILLLLGAAGVIYAVVLFGIMSSPWFDTHPPKNGEGGDEGDGGEAGDDETVWTADRRLYVYPMLAILLFFVARMIATKGVNTFVPAFITEVYGYTFAFFGVEFEPESFANFYFSMLLLMAAAVQLVTGTLTDRYDHRKILVGFLGVATVALAILSLWQLSPLPLLLVLLVIGGGLWGLNPARDSLISEITPAEREGRTFGYLWTTTQMIGALSPVVVGAIADVSGIQSSFRWLAVATFVSALAITLLFSDRVYLSAARQEQEAAAAD